MGDERWEAVAYGTGRRQNCGHRHRSWQAASKCAYENHKADARAGRRVAWGFRRLNRG